MKEKDVHKLFELQDPESKRRVWKNISIRLDKLMPNDEIKDKKRKSKIKNTKKSQFFNSQPQVYIKKPQSGSLFRLTSV